jgi:hypothetical protein
LALADLLSVIGTRHCLGRPFLLEKCSVHGGRAAEPRHVIQVVLAP